MENSFWDTQLFAYLWGLATGVGMGYLGPRVANRFRKEKGE